MEEVNLDISLTRKGDFVNLSNWFNKKIKLNHGKEPEENINKWKICKVDYWMNIWTEINWIRPSIIFKNSNYKYWEDILVIPITSFKDWEIKSVDEFDVEILKSENNWLKNNSLIKIRQLKSVSKKRLKRNRKWDKIIIMWEVEEKYFDEIHTKVKIMLWI